MTQPPLTYLITGATPGGIGLETARQIFAHHASTGAAPPRIIVTLRTREKADAAVAALSPNVVIPHILDLADLGSVRSFAAEILAAEPFLHALVNNAGVMAVPTFTRSKQGHELHFAVNYLGPFLLTQLLTPLLQSTAAASGTPTRVVNVSSDAHLWVPSKLDVSTTIPPTDPGSSYSHRTAYGISKYLQILHTRELNRRFYFNHIAPSIVSMAVHPGIIPHTGISRHMGMGLVAKAGGLVYYTMKVASMFQRGSQLKPKTIEEGAQTTVAALIAPLPVFQAESELHNYWKDGQPATRVRKMLLQVKPATQVWEKTLPLLELASRL